MDESTEKMVDYIVKFMGSSLTLRQRIQMYEDMHRVEKIASGMLSDGESSFILDSFAQIRKQYSVDIELDYKPSEKAGRLANGAERDHGSIVHAVGKHGALCGTTTGRLSGGWVKPYPDADDTKITCDKCAKAIAKLLAVKMAELIDSEEKK